MRYFPGVHERAPDQSRTGNYNDRFGRKMRTIIETYAQARAGLLGNPSDGYYGKTIAFSMSNFRARVLLYPSARLEIRPSKADLPIFENLDDLYRTTRWRGYYG